MTTQATAPERSSFLADWDWFWFHPRNPATLGLIRFFTGLILLYIHFCYCFGLLDFVSPKTALIDEQTFRFLREDVPMMAPENEWPSQMQIPMQFGPNGQPLPVDPTPYLQKYRLASGQYLWSVYFHLHDDAWIWTVHYVFFGILVLFTLGLWTRLTTVLAWIINLQYIHRSPQTLFGMDTMTTLGLFYLMIGPAGARFSLDYWLAQWRERRRRGDPTYVLPVAPSVLANVSIRMMQIQFCLMYLAAGTSKLLGASWWNGTAIWNTVANYEFAPFYLSFYEPALRSLATYRPVWEVAMTGGVIFTLLLELGFPFLVWLPRWRWVCVIGAVLLHTGIGLLMGLVTFSLMMLVLVASFIPSEVVERSLRQPLGWKPVPETIPVATTPPRLAV